MFKPQLFNSPVERGWFIYSNRALQQVGRVIGQREKEQLSKRDVFRVKLCLVVPEKGREGEKSGR